MKKKTIVGTSVTRVDALEKVTGRAQYCTDIKLPRMLFGKILWSSRSHAKILNIDTQKAMKIPGVKAVITGKDIPDNRYGIFVFDKHVLARDIVRNIGDPVAAVAAESMEAAEKAIEMIDVEYEDLPSIFSVEDAWVKNPQVIVHSHLKNYKRGQFHRPQLDDERPNVCQHYKIRHGDIEKGFKDADFIVENRYTLPRIHACTLEPHVCIVKPESDGGITLYASRQSIHMARKYLMTAFDLPTSKVRVVAGYIGGGFGAKVPLNVEPVAAVLAMKAGRPTKLTFNREEMFVSGGTRIQYVVDIKDGIKSDGTLTARQIQVLLNVGAYSGYGPVITRNCTFGMVGTYRIPNVKVDSYAVYTNEPIVAPLRGLGSAEVNFAIESQMDILAETIGMDSVELRSRNLLNEGDVNANGEIVHSIGAGECLKQVAKAMEWNSKPKDNNGPWKRGKGLALGNKYSMAPMAAVAIVKIIEDGTVQLRHSADEIGQGANTVLSQVVAEEFGISMDKVAVVWGDTSITPYFPGSSSHRTTYYLGNAIRLACSDAKQQIYKAASDILKASPEELETDNGLVYLKTDKNQSIKLTDLFVVDRPLSRGEYGIYVPNQAEIIGKGVFYQPSTPEDPATGQIDAEEAKRGIRLCAFYGYAAQGIELKVNVETGAVRMLKAFASSDMGFPINPKLCEQQMKGGLIMGLGSALWEQMHMENGVVLNPNFTDYKLPCIADIPTGDDFQCFMAPVPHKDGPYGAKGVGETQMVPTAPAVANAVYDAVGIRVKDLPITSERIYRLLKKKQRHD